MRLLRLVVMAGAVLFSACPAPPCGPGSCFGCCTATGECVGSGPTQCGENGVACDACLGAEVCAAGVCTVLNRGGGSATGGGSSVGGGQAGSSGGGSAGGVTGGGASGGGFAGGAAVGGGRAGGSAVGGGSPVGGGSGGGPTCMAPRQNCSGFCADTSNDTSNCGVCGRRCGFGETCSTGQCRPMVCTPGSFCSFPDAGFGSCCDGVCRATSTDPLACGGCGLSCPTPLCASRSCVTRCGADAGVCGAGTECISQNNQRACAITTCTAATENSTCSLGGERAGRCCNSACVDLDRSPNCGACGTTCSGSMQCLNRFCQTPANCTSAMVNTPCSAPDGGTGACCDGQCKPNVTLDQDNCGGCGRACGAGTSCAGGGACISDAGTYPDCAQSCSPGSACVQQRCVRTDCTGANVGQACGPFQVGACCGGAGCADLRTSTQHCGSCGRACRAGEFCNSGSCQATPTCSLTNDGTACPVAPGQAGLCCGGACVDALSSGTNCGQCNAQCGAGATCRNGQCSLPDAGYSYCSGTGGNQCPAGTACQSNKCTPLVCPPGSSGGACAFGVTNSGTTGQCCLGRCVELTQDPANCGACGRPCTNGLCTSGTFGSQAICLPASPSTTCFQTCQAGRFCLNGLCESAGCGSGPPGAACLAGNAVGACCGFIGQQCVDLRTDSSNCGACGSRCSGVCIGGVCQTGGATCQRGDVGRYCNPDAGTSSLCCAGAGCVDTQTNNANCGGCGNACGAGLSCSSGRCVAAVCTPGLPNNTACSSSDGGLGSCCGTSCTQQASDPLNCGQCGRLCAVGEVCSSGACAIATCNAGTGGALCHTGDAGVGSCCSSGCVATRSDPMNCGACNRQCPGDAGCVSGMCR